VGITEVVKVVLEDKASGQAKAMALKINSALNLTGNDTAKLQRKIEDLFADTLVNGPAAAVKAIAAVGVAFVGLGAAAIKAAYDSDKEWEKFTGNQTALVTSIDDVAGAFEKIAADSGRMLFDLLGGAKAADELAQNLLKIDRGIKTGNKAQIGMGVGGLFGSTGQLGSDLYDLLHPEEGVDVAAILRRQLGPEGDALARSLGMAPRSKSPELPSVDFTDEGLPIVARTRKEIEAEAKRAADEQARREKAMDSAVERLHPMDDQAIANRRRDLMIARDKEIADYKEHQAQLAEALGQKQDREEIERLRKMSDFRKEQIADEEEASRKLASSIGSAASSLGSLFAQIASGGADAEDVLLSLANTALSFAANAFVPGGGAAASGIFGFLGGLLGFAHGGSIPRAAQGMRIPGVGHGDNTLVMAKPGETIVPTNATHPSFAREVAAALGGVTGGHTTVNLSQSYMVPPDAVQAQRNLQRGLLPVLQDLSSTGRGTITNPRNRGGAGKKRT